VARIGIVVGVIVIVGASIFFGFRKAARAPAATEQAAGSSSPAASTTSASTRARPGSNVSADSPLPEARSLRRIDPEARKRLLENIARARARRTQALPPAPTSAPPQQLSKEYFDTQLREIIPLVNECYTKALEDEPQLAGKLAVKFVIGGEPDVGGLVESSEVDPTNSTIAHADMIECVRETMYGAEFLAPTEGGRIGVHYTFELNSTPKPEP